MKSIYDELESDFYTERTENTGVQQSVETAQAGEMSENKKQSKAKSYTFSRKGLAAFMAVCVFVSGLCGAGGALLADSMGAPAIGGQAQAADPSIGFTGSGTTLEEATGSKLTVQQIIDQAENAVVEIRTEQVANDSFIMQYVREGAGSGVVISKDGYIMTNNHVISNASKITITLKNGEKYEAELVGTDKDSDVAVLKIDADNLTPAIFGNSDGIQIGDLAVAIGNPLGQLGGTATAGIISALDRQLTIEGKTMTLLQTDASINPGNSGGGLFDQHGQMIGLVVAKSAGSDVEGLGFAIPINTAKDVALQLIDHGYVKGRVSIGLSLVDLTSMQNAIYYGVRTLGIYVDEAISPGAKAAGFQKGDMLYYIGEAKIGSMDDVFSALKGYKVGDKVKCTVVRGEEMKELTVALGEKTKDQ